MHMAIEKANAVKVTVLISSMGKGRPDIVTLEIWAIQRFEVQKGTL